MRKHSKKPSQVVSGNTNIAVALTYDGQNAPKVTAKGDQRSAEQIIALAEQHGIPLFPDPQLAATLVQVPLGDEVPDSLYVAVAEVISFAYLLAGKMPAGFAPDGSRESSNES